MFPLLVLRIPALRQLSLPGTLFHYMVNVLADTKFSEGKSGRFQQSELIRVRVGTLIFL